MQDERTMTDALRPNMAGSESALAGTLVVEIGSRVGAGVCGSLLAQLGATVILVEDAGQEQRSGKMQHRAQFSAGKLSIVADPVREPGLIGDLIASSDVVITSTDIDGALASKMVNVVCDITAYGHTGALAGTPDSELQIQAVTGIMETTGLSDGPPVPIALPVVEFMTGVYAAGATIAALRVKAVTGAGQRIDMALYDCAFAAMATFLPRVLTGDTEPIKRIGNRHTMIAPWNVYQARDGWILICVGNDAQWQRFCDIMRRPEFATDAKFIKTADRVANAAAVDQLVQAWVGKRKTADCLAALNEAQIACGPVAPIDGHPREANLDFRHMICRLNDPVADAAIFIPASPLRMSASPGRGPDRIPAPDADRTVIKTLLSQRAAKPSSAVARPMPRAALDGLRVVEIGHYTTVPLSTRLLASLGADVIKIEPPEGEATRDWPPAQRGQGYFFTYMNSDKRSLMLDLRRDADAAILRDLLKTADILIENLKPGALARRGFSAQALASLNPKLIYCGVCGFGAHSLYAGRPAYDTVIQAMSGVMDVVRSDGVPVKTGISSADLMGAEMAVLALLAALSYRDRTGKGQYIDLSMQDIAAWMTQTAWNGADPAGTPSHLIACSDGFVLAEASTGVLARFRHAGLADDLRSSQLGRNEVVGRLGNAGIRAASVLSVHEMMAAPNTQSRELWFRVTEDGETWPLLASPLRLAGTPPVVRHPMPRLGRDNAEIEQSLHVTHAVGATFSS
jgi:crotonobetainyl-CoA:carnitine CoA-transferase CaiB-like acyl-CoA transferase